MTRLTIAIALFLMVASVGCQRQPGGGFHLYGTTRVPPPPTHSYTLPQTYYPNSNTPPQQSPTGAAPGSTTRNFDNTPAQFQDPATTQPIGSGVPTQGPSSLGGVRLNGMPVNDATRLPPAGRLPTRPAYEPRTGMPAASGLQFIRRTSVEADQDESRNIRPATATTTTTSTSTAFATGSETPQAAWRSR